MQHRLLSALLLGIVWCATHATAQETPPADEAEADEVSPSAQEQFDAGIAAYNQGDCAMALQHLETALALDADRLDARMPLADCYHERGELDDAIMHLTAFIAASPDGPERTQAEKLLQAYLRQQDETIAPLYDPETPPPPEPKEKDTYAMSEASEPRKAAKKPKEEQDRAAAPGAPMSAPAPVFDTAGQPLLMADVLVGGGHVFTAYEPTFSEIDLGVRLYPIPLLGVGVAGGLGIGGGPGIEGALRFPEIRICAGFMPPVRNSLLQIGGELLLVGSKQDGADVVDAGGTFLMEWRAPVPGSPLYLGGGFGVGHLVGPYVVGRLALGIVLVEKGGAP